MISSDTHGAAAQGELAPRAGSSESVGVMVLGSLNMDLVARCHHIPVPGETVLGTHFETHHGGKGANQAVAAARMGARVAMVGCVGADAYGQSLKAALQADGIAVHGVRSCDSQPTGVALIAVAQEGQNSIVVVPGANAQTRLDDWLQAHHEWPEAGMLVAQLEVPLDVVHQAISDAKSRGMVTVLNAAPAQALPAELLEKLSWLVVNETEAQAIAKVTVTDVETARHAARTLLDMGPKQVIVTLGSKGLMHGGPLGCAWHPAIPVQAVDTTGAGDTFVGAFVAGIAQGKPEDEALRWGQSAAAIAVTRPGAQSSMPHWKEVFA
jgi:ribokinase